MILSEQKEYRALKAMRARCYNKRHTFYRLYGGRGISVCERWMGEGGYNNFLNDVGVAPTKHHSIDRIDGDRNYEPGNVRWATSKEQAQNRRYGRFIEIGGNTKRLTDWAAEFGIDPDLVSKRISTGVDPVDALTTPVNHRRTIMAAERENILSLYKSGKRIVDIAKETGIKYHTIYSSVKDEPR